MYENPNWRIRPSGEFQRDNRRDVLAFIGGVLLLVAFIGILAKAR